MNISIFQMRYGCLDGTREIWILLLSSYTISRHSGLGLIRIFYRNDEFQHILATRGMLLDQLKGRHNDDLIAMNLIQAFFYVWWFDIEDVYSFRSAEFSKTYGLPCMWYQFIRCVVTSMTHFYKILQNFYSQCWCLIRIYFK